ncbi:hypothetical protein [Absidia glauca]|uniref:Uncharacterized protein n=1 Tax=Absidia glauca TaxID=4829 RepID=A0A168RMC3_ABSGL|nr:hypothetical protein [Absidia glauca]
MSDKSEQKKRDQLLELEEEDVDSIPIVELSLGDEGDRSMKAKKSKKGTKKRNHTRIPTPPPPIYAEEEMPENAAISGSENEDANEKDDKTKKGATKKKKAATYTKKDTHDIFANKDEDESGLHDVDLNTPLGDEERFPQSQTYLTPEQVRENEVARLKAERKEQRAAAKAKSKKSGSGEKTTSKKKKSSSSKTKLKTSGTNNETTPDDQVDHDRKPKDANLISL